MNDVSILPLPAFNDNYIWVLRVGTRCVVVDPGDAAPVLDYLQRTDGVLDSLLITHHHGDHVGGIATLLREAPRDEVVTVIGPATESIPHLTHPVHGGERITLAALNTEFEVLAVPGHTAGHVAYYGRKLGPAGALFCGDTLFGAGCGRLFEGTPAQMQASLGKIAVLPALTFIYCAHEYTEANLRFALAAEPANPEIAARAQRVAAARARGEATVPLRLDEELATNPFLRWDAPTVQAAAAAHLGHAPADAVETFAAIRRWKDMFR